MSHLVPLLEFNQVQFFHEFKPVERPPVYELSAVNGDSLRFKCSATPPDTGKVRRPGSDCIKTDGQREVLA